MMKFSTAEEREAANVAIGAEIQRRGQLENPNYICERYVEEILTEDGSFFLPYTDIADELGIEYESD